MLLFDKERVALFNRAVRGVAGPWEVGARPLKLTLLWSMTWLYVAAEVADDATWAALTELYTLPVRRQARSHACCAMPSELRAPARALPAPVP